MPIWEHQLGQGQRSELELSVKLASCPFCRTPLTPLPRDVRVHDSDPYYRFEYCTSVSLCSICGWWKAIEDYESAPVYSNHEPSFPRELTLARSAGVAVLREFDLTDLSLPLHEVRQFLLARFSRRFTMHPRLFEMTVASIFKSAGYDVVLTAYTNDGGIDAILQDAEGTVGVQVKRWKDSVDVDQIRALAGALLQHGHTRGVFVTTSQFQSGAERTTAQLAARGYPIELIDAPRLFDALKIGLRPAYSTVEEMRSAGLLARLQSLSSRTAR